MNKKAIGIFDSGIGGLAVSRTIRHALPHENIIYVADSRFSPYGTKDPDFITQRSLKISSFLHQQGCKAIVIACNTATVTSVAELRKKFTIPFIGIEPGVKPAIAHSKSGKVGVLATQQTLQSSSFKQLCQRFNSKATIYTQACPQLVNLVEQGAHTSEEMVGTLQKYLAPLIEAGVDSIALACTHFLFLEQIIAEIVGPNIEVINISQPVCAQLKRQMRKLNIATTSNEPGKSIFFSSGSTILVEKQLQDLLNLKQIVHSLP